MARNPALNRASLGAVKVYPKGADVQLTKNFHIREFEDKLKIDSNHFTLINMYLVQSLQTFRNITGLPVIITSSFRTSEKNGSIGGSPESFHTIGFAADWHSTIPIGELKKELDKNMKHLPFIGGVGYYPDRGFIHTDVRPKLEEKVVTWTG